MVKVNHFLTAGFGRYRGAGLRLKQQAEKSGLSDNVYLYDQSVLKKDPCFWSHHQGLMNDVPSGYFVWKPYIILSVMMMADDNDVIFYCDAGCELNPDGNDLFLEWVALCKKKDLVVFSSGCHWKPYCKSETQKYFSEQPIKKDYPLQVATGFLFIKNSPETRAFIRKWYMLSCLDDYRLLNEQSFGHKENEGFKAHRHEQAILHCLLMRTSLDVHFMEETLWRDDWRKVSELPVLAMRNRYIFSVLPNAIQRNDSTLPVWKKVLAVIAASV